MMGKGLFFAGVSIAFLAVIYMYFFEKHFHPSIISNKVILITGASGGIGEQLAYQYARFGARLILTARREKVLMQVADKCRHFGSPQVEIIVGDMSEDRHREEVIQETERRFAQLDVLILNHVIIQPGFYRGSHENMTKLEHMFKVNFFSYVDLATRALSMLGKSRGSICVLSSVAGVFGFPTLSTYSASKFALQGFFSSLRQELIFRETDVMITLCILGLVDTENALTTTRDHYYNADLTWIAQANDAALAILKNVALRKPTMYYPTSVYFFIHLHSLFTDYVDSILRHDMCENFKG